MRYVVSTEKSVEQASIDLKEAVTRNGFGVLHMYDLKETLHNKGFDLRDQCRIFEICNPQQALRVLTEDMGLNMALPCRISIYEEDGTTKIGMLRPTALLSALSPSPDLATVAREVEDVSVRIIEEAR